MDRGKGERRGVRSREGGRENRIEGVEGWSVRGRERVRKGIRSDRKMVQSDLETVRDKCRESGLARVSRAETRGLASMTVGDDILIERKT